MYYNMTKRKKRGRGVVLIPPTSPIDRLLKESMELWRWRNSLWTNMGRIGRTFPDDPKPFDFILILKEEKKDVSDREHLTINNGMNAPFGSVIWAVDSASKGRRTGAESDTPGDWLESRSIILLGFISKTEERKEDEGTGNNYPTWELSFHRGIVIIAP